VKKEKLLVVSRVLGEESRRRRKGRRTEKKRIGEQQTQVRLGE